MTAVRKTLSLALALTVAVISNEATCIAQMTTQDVYFAKEIWTGDRVIKDGMMVVVDGQITKIGSRDQFDGSSSMTRHDLGNQVIIPGLVAAQTNLGGTQPEDETLTPQILSIDGFDFFADQSKLLAAGITSAQISPSSSRLMPGTGAVVQLAGDVIERIVSDRESLRIVLTSDSRKPPRIYRPPVGPVSVDRPLEPTKPQVASLPASLAVLRQVFKQAKTGKSDDELIAAVQVALDSKTPIRISASTTAEIRGALNLANEYGFKIVLDDCRGLEPFKSQFSDWKDSVAGVILVGPEPGKITNPSADDIEKMPEPWQFARELLDAGIPVAIRTENDANLDDIMFTAGLFMQGGMSAEETLASITSVPAKIAGVAKQIGTLQAGRRADFVALSDAPFQLHSRVMQTFVSGESVYQVNKNKDTIVVRANQVYVGDGKFIAGNVVVKGKTVRGVGEQVSTPSGAEIRDFGDAVIVPGFVDMGAGLGFGGPISGSVSLSTKLGEQLYGDDPAIKYAREHGITTAYLKAGSGSATPVVAFKLGDDARVIGDPVAIRFKFSGSPQSAVSSNERLLKAGKAYSDSWIKYEKEFAEYEVKKAEADKKKAADAKSKPAKKSEEKTDAKKPEDKKVVEKKDEKRAEKKEVKPPVKTPPKDGEKDPPKKKPLPDPITGTWDGTVENERIPPQFRTIKMELVLAEDKVTGTFTFFTRTIDIENGTFDRATRELSWTITQRGNEVPVKGKLDEKGAFAGVLTLGPLGEAPVVATRTVDKSKKIEEDKPVEKEKPVEKDKPVEKPADGKKEEAKKEEAKDDDKKEDKKEAEKPKQEELKPPKKPTENKALEPYRVLFSGKIPAIVEATNLYSIKAAAELFSKQYKLRTIIEGADDLARQPDLLKDYDVSFVVGPSFSVTIDKNPPTNMPQLFAIEQFKFGFQSNGTTGSGQLPAAVQFAIRNGLSSIDALNGLTQNPASMLSDEMNFGRIASGKDADLVVLSGPPFEFSTKVLAVMIDGQWVYEREEQK